MNKRKHLKKENKEIKMELMQYNNIKTIRKKKVTNYCHKAYNQKYKLKTP